MFHVCFMGQPLPDGELVADEWMAAVSVRFQNLEAHGVGFEHKPGLATGQGRCCLRIQRQQRKR